MGTTHPTSDHQARNDAVLAEHARRDPRSFARLLNSAGPEERRAIEERVTRGLAWLERNRTRPQTD